MTSGQDRSHSTTIQTTRAHEEALAHAARRAIVDHLQQNPGATLRDLLAVTSNARSSLLYHLRYLRKKGLITQTLEGRVMLYALRTDEDLLHDPAFLAQRLKRHEFVLRIVASEPGITQSELAIRAGITTSYVSRILGDLLREGRIELIGRSPHRLYRVVGDQAATTTAAPASG